MKQQITGVTFAHPRITRPLRRISEAFSDASDSVEVIWNEHPLEAFEELSLCNLSERYDIFAFDHPLIGDALNGNCLVNLEASRPGLSQLIAPQALGLSLSSYRVGSDALYGVPFDGAAQVAAYVRSEFDNNPPPRSLDELMSFIDERGQSSVAIPLRPAHAGCTLMTIAASIAPLSASDSRFFLEPNRLSSAYSLLSSLAKHINPDSFALDPIEMLDRMATESPIVYSPFTFGYGTYASELNLGRKISFADSLPVSGSPNRAILGGAGIGVSSRSPHKEEAIDFVNYLITSPDAHDLLQAERGQSGLRSQWKSTLDSELDRHFFEPTRNSMETGFVRPRYPGFVSFLKEFGSLFRSAHQDAMEPDAFVTRANEMFNQKCEPDSLLEAITAEPDGNYDRPSTDHFTPQTFSATSHQGGDGRLDHSDRGTAQSQERGK